MTSPRPAVPPQAEVSAPAITAALREADRLGYERISTKSVTAMLEAAAPHLAAAERDRSEALIFQAQDYARAESERADQLAALALKALNECHALHPAPEAASHLNEWSLALQQLEGAAGDMSAPDSDPLKDAYRTGIKAERERCAQLAEQVGATYPVPPALESVTAGTTVIVGDGYPLPPFRSFAGLLRKDHHD